MLLFNTGCPYHWDSDDGEKWRIKQWSLNTHFWCYSQHHVFQEIWLSQNCTHAVGHLCTYHNDIEGASPFFLVANGHLDLLFQCLHTVLPSVSSSPNWCSIPITATYIALLFSSQLSRVALMEQFVWLMDLWRVLAEWRSASMDCGEQCVTMTGITMMPELCADNWGTVWTQDKVS